MFCRILLIATILILPMFLAGVVHANDTESGIRAVMIGYEQAWSKRDAKAVASYYHEPAIRGSRVGPTARPTIKSQEIFFEGFLGSLVIRGYDYSDWESLNIHIMNAQTAVAGGITLRYKKDGTLMERAAVSYGLWKTIDGWEIFWSTTHTPEGVM